MDSLFRLFQIFLVLMSLYFGCSLAFGTSPPLDQWLDWKEAKELYDSKKFEEALQVFQKHPREDANYFYNLGTTYYHQGKLGPALAHLEKANQLRPHDANTQFNLSLVRAALVRSVGAEKLDPASSWIEQVADRLPLDEARTAAAFLALLVMLLWIRAYLSTRNLKKALYQPSGLLGILGFSISLGIFGLHSWADAHPSAICLQRALIRSGPADHYLELGYTEEGTKVRLLGSSTTNPTETWRQVRFSPEGIGWVKSRDLFL